MPKVVGHNVRKRRDLLGMTAATLGERIGAVFGKTWPRQTVYMMEAGDRSMIAAEVAALAQILETTPAQLLAPPLEADAVEVGTARIPRASLMFAAEDDSPAEGVLRTLRALQRSQSESARIIRNQDVLLRQAQSKVLAEPAVAAPSSAAEGVAAEIADAQRWYGDEALDEALDNNHGEDTDNG
jgi:transcriptional regulator with XRE-family HTH domain